MREFEKEVRVVVMYLYLLNRITTADGLPDGSGKPGEALWAGIVPDLKRTAGTKDDYNTAADSPLLIILQDYPDSLPVLEINRGRERRNLLLYNLLLR